MMVAFWLATSALLAVMHLLRWVQSLPALPSGVHAMHVPPRRAWRWPVAGRRCCTGHGRCLPSLTCSLFNNPLGVEGGRHLAAGLGAQLAVLE